MAPIKAKDADTRHGLPALVLGAAFSTPGAAASGRRAMAIAAHQKAKAEDCLGNLRPRYSQ
jgi:hypothetical protein